MTAGDEIALGLTDLKFSLVSMGLGMAQVNKQSIVLGGGRIVGNVSVDAGTLRGEGGPARPQLVLRLTIEMNPTPESAMLAVCWVRGRLATDENASPHMAICQPVSEYVSGFHAHSTPGGPNENILELRFFLTPAEVEDIERRRHAAKSDIFMLYLSLDPVVAAIRSHNSFSPGSPQENTPWDSAYGMFSEVMPFWTAQIWPVRIPIERSTWVRDVLPGLGYDRKRLIELDFPPPLPDHPSAASQFDKARRALDERRYDDCIQECRGLLNMWEKQFGATMKLRVAEIVGESRRWPAGDVRQGLLDALWKEVGDVANAPHHPEGEVDAQTFDAKDARLLLLVTAALSEYVRH